VKRIIAYVGVLGDNAREPTVFIVVDPSNKKYSFEENST
jgi:hypothetical protein